MNKLSIISKFLVVIQILLITGSLFAVIFLSGIDDKMVTLGNPLWEIADNRSVDHIGSFLPVSGQVDVEKVLLNLKVPLTSGFRWAVIALIILFVGYLLAGLKIIRKIVKEVKANRPFTMANATRIKHLGVLVALAPILTGILSILFSGWLESVYKLEGLNPYSEDGNGLVIFIIGLLIYVLGMAFAQGVKLQEENELTI